MGVRVPDLPIFSREDVNIDSFLAYYVFIMIDRNSVCDTHILFFILYNFSLY